MIQEYLNTILTRLNGPRSKSIKPIESKHSNLANSTAKLEELDMIKLRPATINDLDLLLHWDTKQHVIDCDPDDEWNWEVELGKTPCWREQLMAELDGEPIGFIQIIDPYKEETKYCGKVGQDKRAIDIWIGEEDNLNKGYGTIMMNLATDRCFSDPSVNAILIDPLKTNTKAHRFYERLGFEFVEERVFNETACYVYELTREAAQRNVV